MKGAEEYPRFYPFVFKKQPRLFFCFGTFENYRRKPVIGVLIFYGLGNKIFIAFFQIFFILVKYFSSFLQQFFKPFSLRYSQSRLKTGQNHIVTDNMVSKMRIFVKVKKPQFFYECIEFFIVCCDHSPVCGCNNFV